jgi:hypothetical protein
MDLNFFKTVFNLKTPDCLALKFFSHPKILKLFEFAELLDLFKVHTFNSICNPMTILFTDVSEVAF